MILYSSPSPAPNPRRVRIFAAEKGVALEVRDVSLLKREHKAPEFLEKNSRGQTPSLELADGTVISESVSICRYLDAACEGPKLFGATAKEAALIDMWIRRVEFGLMQPVGSFWAHAHPLTARVITQFKEFGESNRARTMAAYAQLEKELGDNPFIAGQEYTAADVMALTTVDFADWIGLPMGEETPRLKAWRARVSERPSAQA